MLPFTPPPPHFPAGVGVPLMLTYVYGVVPMSLCRNGWCRQQAEPPDAHRIQLEDLASCKYRRTCLTAITYSLSHIFFLFFLK